MTPHWRAKAPQRQFCSKLTTLSTRFTVHLIVFSTVILTVYFCVGQLESDHRYLADQLKEQDDHVASPTIETAVSAALGEIARLRDGEDVGGKTETGGKIEAELAALRNENAELMAKSSEMQQAFIDRAVVVRYLYICCVFYADKWVNRDTRRLSRLSIADFRKRTLISLKVPFYFFLFILVAKYGTALKEENQSIREYLDRILMQIVSRSDLLYILSRDGQQPDPAQSRR